MAQLLSGFGRIVFRSLSTAIPDFIFAEPLAFTINSNSSEIVSYKMVNGRKVVAGAKEGMVERTAQIQIEAASKDALALALGVRWAVTNSLDLVELRTKSVPKVTPFEITDTDIGASLGMQAHVTDRGAWGEAGNLTLIPTGAPATGQFRVDSTNNKLIFNAAQAGAPIAYTLIKNYASLQTLGKEQGAAQLNTIAFEGLVNSENDNEVMKLVIPRMIRTKSTSLNFGEKTVLEPEYRMIVAPGEASDFYLVEMPAGYNPG
ncbi:MAG: hypothetical protein ACRCZS_02280 [Chroococcidiopsis sp.]